METKQDTTTPTLIDKTLTLIPNEIWLKMAEQLDADDMSALASTSRFFSFNTKNDAFKKQWIAIKENKDHILCATGCTHTLIYINKTLFVSGYNHSGELGLGHNDTVRYFVECRPTLQPNERITQVVAGGYFSYLLTNRKRVLVCGDNLNGELGQGNYGDINTFSECIKMQCGFGKGIVTYL